MQFSFYNNKKRKRKLKASRSNSSLNILLALIFLAGGFLSYRLISLQVFKYDFYTALASDQHLVFRKLLPKRGRIFIQDNDKEGGVKLYPLATNKDFAFIYAIPKKVEDAQKRAEELYQIFKASEDRKEVEQALKKDSYFFSLFPEEYSLTEEEKIATGKTMEELKEFWEIKRDLNLERKKEEGEKYYFDRLSKKDDPYEPIKRKASDEELKKIIALDSPGLDFFYEKHRYYPENEMGANIVGFVGYKGEKEAGRYGLEGFFNEELAGKVGSIKTERAADGKQIIINDRELNSAQDGSDIILTINRSIQYIVCKRLGEVARRYGADGGSIIVMEPQSGRILAMCSWPDYDPNQYGQVKSIELYNNPAIFDAYEPGSIFKAFTLAGAIDSGKLSPNSLYNDQGSVMISGWNKAIKNSDFESHGGYGLVDMNTVLEKSLNTGTIFAVQKIGEKKFAEYVKKFGFGEKTGIELETEGISNIDSLLRANIRPIEAATASFGQGITATPLQLTVAYSAIANGGTLMKPYIVSEIISPDGLSLKTQPQALRRVISERTALLISGMLVNVVDGGHAKKAGVMGYYVAGKTGTAQVASKGGYGERTIHTFVGFAPVEDAKFVMLVKLDDPKSVRFSASSAAPLFGELAEFILNYYQVKKSR